MAIESVLIPEERKRALIGKNGKTKSDVERQTRTRITVRDDVLIEGDPLDVMTAKNIVAAIGRGFAPEEAMNLLSEEYTLEIISLRHESEKSIHRLLSRVIGRNGESKKIIEDETGAKVCVYGKTVSIIGDPASLPKARETIELLLKGKTHAYAFRRMRGE